MIRRFQDLHLARKVLLIPAFTLMLLGLVLGVALYNTWSNMVALEHLERDGIGPLHDAYVLKDRITVVHGHIFALLAKRMNEGDLEGWKRDVLQMTETFMEQDVALTVLTNSLRDRSSAQDLEELTKTFNAWRATALDTIEAALGSASNGELLMLAADDRFVALRQTFDRIAGDLLIRRQAFTRDMVHRSELARTVMAALGLLAVLLGVLGSIAVGRGIARPITHLAVVIKRLAEGDIASTVPDIERQDEVGDIARAVEVFRHNAIAKRATDDELSRTHWQLDLALNNMSQGLCLFDVDGTLRLWNWRFAEVVGIPADVVRQGMPFREMIAAFAAAGIVLDGSIDRIHDTTMIAVAGGQPSRLEARLVDGRNLAISREPLPEGGWVATYEDTTEKRRSEERIVYLARHDPLTELPNRRLLRERLDQALARASRGERFAVLCLDLDHFKKVNDTLGHDAGDQLLRAVAERLVSCVREVDMVARLGGDEFAILQENIDGGPGAALLAARIIEVVGGMVYKINGHQVIAGTSVGIAIGPDDGSSSDTLLRNADVALYYAKQERGRFTLFEVGMNEHLRQRRIMEVDLRRAIAHEEFELYYQPLLTLDHSRVIALEALVRWHHPERGMIPPGEFIPLAEETGLITPIGEWILHSACWDAMTWPDEVTVAVNLSPIQFKGNRLFELVEAALRDSNLPPHRLELEITESALLRDNEPTVAMLHRIRALGVHISMDDFGTGYSSLSYLHKFPFDKIKIDRSFVTDITHKKGTAEIVRAIAALGRSLGMRTVAEGVETTEQLEALRQEGCLEVQGYLFSRPVPCAQVPAMLVRLGGVTATV